VAEAVVFVDRYHRVTGANPAALRQYPGLAPGQDFFFLFDEASTLVTQWSHAEARTSRVEPLSLHVSGVAVSVSVAPHYDRFGDFVGAVALVSEGRQSDWEARCASLSPREREVVDLIVQGLSNQDIADRLFLSLGTVKRHVHEVLAKMNVARREELKVLQTGGTT
jgi:DNA-binding CsgD family transcriptional regulator